jgi:predicted ferric reductase
MREFQGHSGNPGRWVRWSLGALIIGLVVVALAGAPFIALRGHAGEVAEYGALSAGLITSGKILGLVAGVLLAVQLFLGAKSKLLDRIFGLHRLLRWHRTIGIVVAVAVSLHPLLIFSTGAREIGPLRFAVWPVLLGALLLIDLWAGVLAARFRPFVGVPYHIWFRLHRAGMWTAVPLLVAHAFVVTGDLNSGWPFMALIGFLSAYVGLLGWKAVVTPLALRMRRFTVKNVSPAGKDAYAVELALEKGRRVHYLPGQFAFVSFRSPALPREVHPWTISSTPTRKETLIFTIKCSGDFTARIGGLQIGDRALVDAPFGDFSHRIHAPDPKRHVVMIAGGVGITPMLSMLRYMADREKDRGVTLIWSNRTAKDILCRRELEDLRSLMPRLKIHHVFTRETEGHPSGRRLEAGSLQGFLSDVSRESAVFVCGPPAMMEAVRKGLQSIGFSRRSIHSERFSY